MKLHTAHFPLTRLHLNPNACVTVNSVDFPDLNPIAADWVRECDNNNPGPHGGQIDLNPCCFSFAKLLERNNPAAEHSNWITRAIVFDGLQLI